MVCTLLLAQQDVDTPAAHHPTANPRSGQAIRGLDRLGRRSLPPRRCHERAGLGRRVSPAFRPRSPWRHGSGDLRLDGGIEVLDGRGELAEAVKDVGFLAALEELERVLGHGWALRWRVVRDIAPPADAISCPCPSAQGSRVAPEFII